MYFICMAYKAPEWSATIAYQIIIAELFSKASLFPGFCSLPPSSPGSFRKIDKCPEYVYCAAMDIELRHFRKVGSTMDTAREYIDRDGGSKLIILADEQTAGRGRIEGRSWIGNPGSSLLMTLALKQKTGSPEAFPLRVGLGVLDVLSRLAAGAIAEEGSSVLSLPRDSEPHFLIKWPNDIMGLDRDSRDCCRKLCGILCESSKGWLLAGIGINLRRTAYPDSLNESATSLEEVLGGICPPEGSALPEAEDMAHEIAKAVISRVEDAGWKDDYRKSMLMLENDVCFMVGHPVLGKREQGTISGIDDSGRLLLRNESGEVKAFLSGEISYIRDL